MEDERSRQRWDEVARRFDRTMPTYTRMLWAVLGLAMIALVVVVIVAVG